MQQSSIIITATNSKTQINIIFNIFFIKKVPPLNGTAHSKPFVNSLSATLIKYLAEYYKYKRYYYLSKL